MGKDSYHGKSERPWPNPLLEIGAIVGHTTDTSCRLWFRTGRTGKFEVIYYPKTRENLDDPFLQFKDTSLNLDFFSNDIVREPFQIDNFDNDSTHVVDLDSLQANTQYAYALYSENESRVILGQDRSLSFHTLPASEPIKPLSFGFYSCHMPYSSSLFGGTNLINMEMWDAFYEVLQRHRQEKSNLRFIIGGGDQVYVDGIKTLSIWKYLNKKMRKENGTLFPSSEDMVSWYRDIYHGYWGFPSVKKVFSSFPTYMIWDDHELGDGFGSYYNNLEGVNKLLPDLKEKNLTLEDGLELKKRMFEAGEQVYIEYQHTHNPDTPDNQYDYCFYHQNCGFYFLDGRGKRDVNRKEYRVLGKPQMNRFKKWLESEETLKKEFLFIISAVPVLHLKPAIANMDDSWIAKMADLEDDLRDSWEHKLHNKERKELMKSIFKATSNGGPKISILSGDVHTSAVFKISNSNDDVIYQLTSSSITYNVSVILGWILGGGVPDDGTTDDDYTFERLALYTDTNFSIIKVEKKCVVFQLYGLQIIYPPDSGMPGDEPEEPKALTHSIAKIKLDFQP